MKLIDLDLLEQWLEINKFGHGISDTYIDLDELKFAIKNGEFNLAQNVERYLNNEQLEQFKEIIGTIQIGRMRDSKK